MNEIKYIKLSDLVQQVEDVIKQSFGNAPYWIVAEISGHKFYPNNDRHYFEFIEKDTSSNEPIAKVRGVSWTAGSEHIKEFEKETGQLFTNGIQVLVKVKIDFHKSFGFQLTLLDIDPTFTLGNMELQRRETLLKLVNEYPAIVQKAGDGYITRNKKLLLHAVIQHIAIIGSPNSEGYTDFTHTILSNQYHYKFVIDIYQSSVQGAEAENELISKLIAVFNSGKKYDCVVIIRGGGSKSDFLVFDKFKLALAVAKFPIPIITGIGHHNDVSIVDLMTHTNTKTPTKAAEFIISQNRTFEESVIKMQKSVIIKSQQLLHQHQQLIHATNVIIINNARIFIGQHKDFLIGLNQIVINRTKNILYHSQTNLVALLNRMLSQPKIITAGRLGELQQLISHIKIFSNKYLINQKGYLRHYVSVIQMMSPENILKKGFAIISHNGKIVNNADTINPGDNVTINMQTTQINATVTSKSDTDGK